MARRPVNFHHVAKSMRNPVRSLSKNRHPFLVVRGEGGEEIHYGEADMVHDNMLKKIDRSRVVHAGSIFVDPIVPYGAAGLSRVSWDHPEFGIAPHDVLYEVEDHIRNHVREVKGPETAKKMRIRLIKGE